MSSVALLFPGQGSQYVGMGKFLSDSVREKFFSLADKALGFSLSQIMLEGPEEKLKETAITQPAILTHSVALFEMLQPFLEENQISIDCVLGHSVGEFAALVAAGALSFEDAVLLVHKRGKYMQEATPLGTGSMYALMKVPMEVVQEACSQASKSNEEVMPANFNSPEQIVISGEIQAAKRAVSWIQENYSHPFRAIELKVSAPFHSSLMKPAAMNLKKDLLNTTFHSLKIPYIANVNAEIYNRGTEGEILRENLFAQVDHSVFWTQSMQKLSDNSLCLEVGPGKVLMGLARKINSTIKCQTLDKENSITNLTEFFS